MEPFFNQDTARLSKRTILLDMRFLLDLVTKGVGERSLFLSNRAQFLQESICPGHFVSYCPTGTGEN